MIWAKASLFLVYSESGDVAFALGLGYNLPPSSEFGLVGFWLHGDGRVSGDGSLTL